MAGILHGISVKSLANGLKIAAPTSTAVYYKIILPSALKEGVDEVQISIKPSCMESGSSLSIHGTGDFAGANAVTFAYDTTSARIVSWSVK